MSRSLSRSLALCLPVPALCFSENSSAFSFSAFPVVVSAVPTAFAVCTRPEAAASMSAAAVVVAVGAVVAASAVLLWQRSSQAWIASLRDRWHRALLARAIDRGDLARVRALPPTVHKDRQRALAAQSATVEAVGGLEVWTPGRGLLIAMLFRTPHEVDAAMVGALVTRHGEDVNQRDVGDETALMVAAGFGYDNVVLALVEHGADLEARDASGRTALHHAALDASFSAYDYLVAQGADPNVRCDEGYTAAEYASFRRGLQDVVREDDPGFDIGIDELGQRAPFEMVVSPALETTRNLQSTRIDGAVGVLHGAPRRLVYVPLSTSRMVEDLAVLSDADRPFAVALAKQLPPGLYAMHIGEFLGAFDPANACWHVHRRFLSLQAYPDTKQLVRRAHPHISPLCFMDAAMQAAAVRSFAGQEVHVPALVICAAADLDYLTRPVLRIRS